MALISIFFKDEKIDYSKRLATKNLPEPLRNARKLEKKMFTMSNDELFIKQAKLLENYEDDFEYSEKTRSFFPSYSTLSNEGLRGYFTWRTRIRKGEKPEAPDNYIYIYVYELLNQIGVSNPDEGYALLLDIKNSFITQDKFLAHYFENWLVDYVIYYNLPSTLLEANAELEMDKNINILDNPLSANDDQVSGAISNLGAKWLSRSKFYRAHKKDMDEVMRKVVYRMHSHYQKGCKNSFTEQFFGKREIEEIDLFEFALFSNPLKRVNYTYKVHPHCIYTCKKGFWKVNRRFFDSNSLRKFLRLVKTIDNAMRIKYDFGSIVKQEINLKWLNTVIQEEIDALLERKRKALAEKNKKNRAKIDLSKLDKIREDANIVQDKLVVEEETTSTLEVEEKLDDQEPHEEMALNKSELKLLKCLLNNENLNWIKDEGLILSVLVDGINEKLYDRFGDSVIDEGPSLIEDYRNHLQELI